jgi:hypothetical protein
MHGHKNVNKKIKLTVYYFLHIIYIWHNLNTAYKELILSFEGGSSRSHYVEEPF